MHFEILVEDQSSKRFLDIIVPKIVGNVHTFRVHPYKGVGRIPPNMRDTRDASKRILMENLPRLLKGFGKAFDGYRDYPAVVIVVCDLDDRCLKEFRSELCATLDACEHKPETRFCIAIEEGEAWLLGDLPAVRKAYSKAKDDVLRRYRNDSICDTWEKLADAVYPGGSGALSKKGWQVVGAEKSKWAKAIAPHMSIDGNRSPSFGYFCAKLLEFANAS